MTEQQQSLENKLEQKANAVAKTSNKKPVFARRSFQESLTELEHEMRQ